jgi:hypothetical protein
MTDSWGRIFSDKPIGLTYVSNMNINSVEEKRKRILGRTGVDGIVNTYNVKVKKNCVAISPQANYTD